MSKSISKKFFLKETSSEKTFWKWIYSSFLRSLPQLILKTSLLTIDHVRNITFMVRYPRSNSGRNKQISNRTSDQQNCKKTRYHPYTQCPGSPAIPIGAVLSRLPKRAFGSACCVIKPFEYSLFSQKIRTHHHRTWKSDRFLCMIALFF